MVKTKRLKHAFLWFQSIFNSSACNCCGGSLCIIGKTHKAPQQVFRFILYHISSAPQAAHQLYFSKVLAARHLLFLKCSQVARKIFQMLVLAKINTLLACSQRPFYTPCNEIGSSAFRPG